VLPYLVHNPDLKLKVISDFENQWKTSLDDEDVCKEIEWYENRSNDSYHNLAQLQGHQLAKWADLLFVVTDANLASSMLAGLTTNTVLHVLRCWDTSKRIVMVPEMTVAQWKHPIWKQQQRELEQNWDWVQVLRPALWDYTQLNYLDVDGSIACSELAWKWNGPQEILGAVQDEAQSVIRTSCHEDLRDLSPQSCHRSVLHAAKTKPKSKLPAEVWTIILDFYGDWELATALGIYTRLPVPSEWIAHVPRPGRTRRSLEYTILTGSMPQIRIALSQSSITLSTLATELIFKFSLTPILTYLASHQKDIFWTSFGLALLPHKASLTFNSPKILEWWRTCPAVLKEYGTDALDGASRAGFIEVLDWWLNSGLGLSYTERALENASAKGHIKVLEWWKKANEQKGDSEVPLKVGKSILAAAQSGRANVIKWWDSSGIDFQHEDGVAKLASAYGHTEVLALWRELKGSKMIFDNQVLAGATKNGHAAVLEWWKKSGLSVEYKTCDIEEAMEDSVGGGGEVEVRQWWERNGLNLGVGTGEWMKVKTL
jgi:Flavoprotein